MKSEEIELLKQKNGFFSVDFDGDYHWHDTEEEAESAAERYLEEARDMSGDSGWPDNVTDISYGIVLGEVKQISHTPRPPESEINADGMDDDGNFWAEPHWSHIVDYELAAINRDSPEWVEIRSEADLPKDEVEPHLFRDDYGNCQVRSYVTADEYIAWMPIPPYTKPDASDGGGK